MDEATRKTVALWCAFWFITNLAITFNNKWMLSSVDISPSVLTIAHMICTFVGCACIEKCKIPQLNYEEWKRMFFFSFLFALNIVYAQYGLKLTTLSLNQVTRAMTPLFQAGLEYQLMGRNHPFYTLVPLIPVCFGVALTSIGEFELTTLGLLVSISSVFVSALKGVLSMKILQHDLKAKLQEYSFLLVVSPLSILWILLLQAFFTYFYASSDDDDAISTSNPQQFSSSSFMEYPWMLLFIGGFLAVLVNISSIGTVKRTSATTMGVMANVKQAITIVYSMMMLEPDWTMLKLIGGVITIVGAVWYSERKQRQVQKPPVPVEDSGSDIEKPETESLLPPSPTSNAGATSHPQSRR